MADCVLNVEAVKQLLQRLERGKADGSVESVDLQAVLTADLVELGDEGAGLLATIFIPAYLDALEKLGWDEKAGLLEAHRLMGPLNWYQWIMTGEYAGLSHEEIAKEDAENNEQMTEMWKKLERLPELEANEERLKRLMKPRAVEGEGDDKAD